MTTEVDVMPRRLLRCDASLGEQRPPIKADTEDPRDFARSHASRLIHWHLMHFSPEVFTLTRVCVAQATYY